MGIARPSLPTVCCNPTSSFGNRISETENVVKDTDLANSSRRLAVQEYDMSIWHEFHAMTSHSGIQRTRKVVLSLCLELCKPVKMALINF